jgi:hypothetical protein
MAKGFKTGGRQAGTPNKATNEFRKTISSLLEKNAENVDLWLQQVAEGHGDQKPDPAKALDLLAKLAEFGAPKLSRAEVVGDEDNPLQMVGRIELVSLK